MQPPLGHFDHSRKAFTPYGLTCELWTPTRMNRPDQHNEIEINLLSEGTLTYLFGGRKVTIRSHEMTVFWAGVPHQIIDRSDDAPYFVATLPLPWFLQRRLPQPLVQRILHGEALAAPQAFASDEELFRRWIDDLACHEAEREEIALLEIEARLRRLAYSLTSTPEPHALVLPDEAPSAVERMASFIARHYTEPLTIETISRSVGLHPNYAMNLFRKTFGTTLTTYLNENRVTHAQRLLVMSDASVLDVALDSGFGSLSRFNAAFKAVSGCSPRQYRKLHRG
jgi:AraC-like DNA-binding protein